MFEKIVVCSDGSEPALHALRTAAEIAQKFSAHVVVVHVFDPSTLPLPFAGISDSEMIAAGECGSYADRVFDCVEKQTSELLEKNEIAFKMRREFGHPAERILSAAQDENADLVVVGSRGLNAWRAMVMGSVSVHIVQHAHCQVLVVR